MQNKHHTMRENYNINAILENELIKVLESNGLLETIQRGKANCFVCGRCLSIDNIGAIHVIEGKIKLRCDDEECNTF